MMWGGAEAAQLVTAMCLSPRYLEEGNVPAAETQKRQIEQLQRDRRRVMEENNITHQARFFRWGGPGVTRGRQGHHQQGGALIEWGKTPPGGGGGGS